MPGGRDVPAHRPARGRRDLPAGLRGAGRRGARSTAHRALRHPGRRPPRRRGAGRRVRDRHRQGLRNAVRPGADRPRSHRGLVATRRPRRHRPADPAPHRALGGVPVAVPALHPGARRAALLRGGPGAARQRRPLPARRLRPVAGTGGRRRAAGAARGRRGQPASARSTCSAWTWRTSAPSSAAPSASTTPAPRPASRPTAPCWTTPQRFDSAPAFTRSLHAGGNSRNVDAVSGLYSLYPLLDGGARHGTLLAYGQNRQPDTGSLVSYASMAFYQSGAD